MNPMLDHAGAWLVACACAGAMLGWVVAWGVDRLGDHEAGPSIGRRRFERALVVVAMAAGAPGLWWWEVASRGQLPPQAVDVPAAILTWRWAGHLVFLGFLAAASWIDLRERVIPDAITLPGVLAGIAWSGLVPRALPPVALAVPRSFAAPLFEPDVLGLCGPIGDTVLPWCLAAAPVMAGLAVATALFVGWWLVCTASPDRGIADGFRFDPRLPALGMGLVGIGAAWWSGGDRWIAVLSALVGMATGVACVWATRITASRALGREAVGFGDVTLVAVIGAWLGWQGVCFACCLGVLVGLVHGVTRFVLASDNELPFGPGLCVGALLTIVLWEPLWSRFAPAFERPHEVAAAAGLVITLTAAVLAVWWRLRRGSRA